jgi:predicted dinucleotide-binding enzyme
LYGDHRTRRTGKRVAALIDELGFAPADTGTLADGGRRHAPGGSLYGEVLTAREVTQALA